MATKQITIFLLEIDDRAMFVEAAQELGIQGIIHTSYQSTINALEQFGLIVD
jgi:hypothetical protein